MILSANAKELLQFLPGPGTATLMLEGESLPCSPGSVRFVAAGAVHRFVEFSKDFSAWVVFWGPKGGE